jgi:hypothetical protein
VPTVLDRGLGVPEILAGAGVVVAVYRVAAYLRFPTGLIALTSGLAPRGPLHLRVAVLPPLRAGERVEVDGGALHGDGWTVPPDGPVWTGPLPPLQQSHVAVTRWQQSGFAATPGLDLRDLAARLGGRGPGLTPEGDDVLAGALLATRAARGPDAEPELRAIAAGVRTTEVAAAYLAWAARGQCIEPAHDWLTAEDDGTRTRAEQRLRRTGATSGEALLRGLTAVRSQNAV